MEDRLTPHEMIFIVILIFIIWAISSNWESFFKPALKVVGETINGFFKKS